jgi:hypothetical protein
VVVVVVVVAVTWVPLEDNLHQGHAGNLVLVTMLDNGAKTKAATAEVGVPAAAAGLEVKEATLLVETKVVMLDILALVLETLHKIQVQHYRVVDPINTGVDRAPEVPLHLAGYLDK